MQSLRPYPVAAILIFAASLLAACSTPAPQPPPAAPAYHPVASVREIMNSVIDPSVDVVWNSVKTVIDHGRPTEHAPKTDEEWAEVRRHAMVVIEAPNLLMMHDRAVAPPGEGSRTPGVELAPEEVRALIEKSPAAWDAYARALQEAMKPAIAAIDAKNPQALFEAGDEIDVACENCHQTFWYPKGMPAAAAAAR